MRAEAADAKLTELHGLYYDEVLAYCTRRIGRPDADDVAAEVFAVAWRRIAEIHPPTARAWLFGVARGVLANRWRSQRRHSRLLRRVSGLAVASRPMPDDLAVRRAEDAEVIDALRTLRPRDREVLMLAAWEELTGPEIACALDISVPAAEQRLHRAKRRLARLLRPPASQPQEAPHAEREGGR